MTDSAADGSYAWGWGESGMTCRRRLSASLVLITLLALAVPALANLEDACTGPPLSPSNCVEQLGAIGEPPPASSEEGYRGIVSSLVDPLLLLETTDERNGRLYAIRPASNAESRRLSIFPVSVKGRAPSTSMKRWRGTL